MLRSAKRVCTTFTLLQPHALDEENKTGRDVRPAGERTADSSASYSRLRSSLPGLKRIVFPGGIFTSTPVFGFLPMPFLRCLT